MTTKPNRHAQALGRKGGKVCNPRKGFGNPAVKAKAEATLQAHRLAKRHGAISVYPDSQSGFLEATRPPVKALNSPILPNEGGLTEGAQDLEGVCAVCGADETPDTFKTEGGRVVCLRCYCAADKNDAGAVIVD